MNYKPIIVMVSGRAGEGKTTFSEMCIDVLEKKDIMATVEPFAQGVKDTARFMGWNGEKDDKGRRLLQQIGNCGREYNENIWAERTIDGINMDAGVNSFDVVFIDDWRFPNEGNEVVKTFSDVIKVRICRPDEFHTLNGSELYNDISETSLPDVETKYYGYIIDNIGNLNELQVMAEQFIVAKVLPRLATMED
jgi:hypothetical protein